MYRGHAASCPRLLEYRPLVTLLSFRNSHFMYTYGLRGQFSRLYQNLAERLFVSFLSFRDIIPWRPGLYIGGMIHVSTPAGLFVRVLVRLASSVSCIVTRRGFFGCMFPSSLFACIMGDDFSRQREMRSWKHEKSTRPVCPISD